jgi:nicotinamidase-related amidase
MPAASLAPETSVLVVVDVQPSFLSGIFEAERVLDRVEFSMRIARLLGVPILATEQYPSRMGGTHELLAPLLETAAPPMEKMSFSCAGCGMFMEALGNMGRPQIVIVGIETHICVSQTAHDLLVRGYELVVCPDAVSARTVDRHKLGMERIRDAGAVPAHSEAVAYEWMRSAENPAFREALKLVKDAKY